MGGCKNAGRRNAFIRTRICINNFSNYQFKIKYMIECKTSKEIGGMGHSKKRKEDGRFIQGKGNYIDDLKLPGMLYMDIVRSPYAYAKIKSINIDEAMKVPGVAAVVTGKDLEK